MKINVVFYHLQSSVLVFSGLPVAFSVKDFYHNDKNKDEKDDEFIYQ